jgi:hypothetical protein
MLCSELRDSVSSRRHQAKNVLQLVEQTILLTNWLVGQGASEHQVLALVHACTSARATKYTNFCSNFQCQRVSEAVRVKFVLLLLLLPQAQD